MRSFWLTREGIPSTEFLHLTERFTRTDYDTLKYEATIDDPGAYTAPWTGGWYIHWQPEAGDVRVRVPGQQSRREAHVRRSEKLVEACLADCGRHLAFFSPIVQGIR